MLAERDTGDSRKSPPRRVPPPPPAPPAPNYIVTQPTKSMGIALVLALLFGPIGLFYSSITGGIIMFFVCGIINAIGFLMMGVGLIVTIPITGIMCAIWAYVSVSRYNENLLAGRR